MCPSRWRNICVIVLQQLLPPLARRKAQGRVIPKKQQVGFRLFQKQKNKIRCRCVYFCI
jgi:predicted sugar kinase